MNNNTRLFGISIATALTVALFAPIHSASAATNFEKPCRNADYVKQQVREALGENLTQFELRSFDTRSFIRSGARRPLDLVLPNEKNEMIKLRVSVQEFPGRVKDLTAAFLKGGGTRARTIKLPREMNFQLGKCQKGNPTCGNLAVVGKQVEGFVIDKQIGFALFEPVGMLMKRHGMKRWRGDRSCHIVYNANFHGPIPFDDIPGDKQASRSGKQGLILTGKQVAQDLRRSLESVGNFLIEPANAMPFPTHIPIKLDSDAAFYSLSPSTVWSRQLSVINSVRIIYGLFEPLTNGDWSIIFDVEGQETWLPGYGPTTTDGVDLVDEINDPGYYMIHHADDNELSLFFVGYDVSGGTAGIAGSECNSTVYTGRWLDGIGTDVDHQRVHAWVQQVEDASGYEFSTLYGRIIVATHELGHILGSAHAEGCTGATCCAAGLLSFMCGNSIMMSGASGGVAPDFRDPFFTPDNSAKIKTCVDAVY
ncbi:MAG: hypothetical protein HN900_06845 [Gammaproteobacteria bacterium]|jgi:hypothetical protein|nr:hypothetical protein [Gammaproteobacteria bacterium]